MTDTSTQETTHKSKFAREPEPGQDFCNGKTGIDHYFSCHFCFTRKQNHFNRFDAMEAMSGQHFEFGQGEGGFV